MTNYPEHRCPGTDDDGRPLAVEMVTCGNCHRSWCERCDPAPAALCPWCHGMGYSTASLPPRQVRKLDEHGRRRNP